jgi:hypothetical protein
MSDRKYVDFEPKWARGKDLTIDGFTGNCNVPDSEPGGVESPMAIDTTSVNAIIGSRLRERRRAKNMSQRELSKRTGAAVSCPFISQIETGQSGVGADKLFAIANALGVDMNYFFKTPKGPA